ncbi:MAG: SDR family oxidoreductase [Actinomycetota bacterium]
MEQDREMPKRDGEQVHERVQGRVVVVTGGGSGIGEALVHAAAAAGAAHVVAVDLNGAEAERVAAAVGGTGVSAGAAEVNVADEDQIRALVADVEEQHGPIGLFCSNAGFVTAAGLEESTETIDRMWDVHVMSHIYAARAVLPSMIANGEGYLLNTASAAGLLTQIGSMAYSVTKHAAVALAEWLAVTHHHQGIGVSVLCPQAVRTNILANSPDRIDDDFDGSPAGGDGVLEPEDVAALCLNAVQEGRFWVLPHPEVAEYTRRKADDIDRWLGGMRRFQDRLHPDGVLPGDALDPRT